MKIVALAFVLLALTLAHAEEIKPYTNKKNETSVCTVKEGNKVLVNREITLKKGETLDSSYHERVIFETKQYDFFLTHDHKVEIHRQLRDETGEQTGSTLAYVIPGEFQHSYEGEDGEFKFFTIECKRKKKLGVF